MGTPNTKIRDILLEVGGSGELTFDEKVTLLEERVKGLVPYLSDMPLVPFTEVEFLRYDVIHTKCLRNSSACNWQIEEGLRRDQQGIYLHTFENTLLGVQTPTPTPKDPNLPLNCHWLCGLDQDGHWLRIEVTYLNGPGYKNRGEQIPKIVSMRIVSTAAILCVPGANLAKLWLLLSKAVERRVTLLESRLNQAREVSEGVQSEDFLIAPFLKMN